MGGLAAVAAPDGTFEWRCFDAEQSQLSRSGRTPAAVQGVTTVERHEVYQPRAGQILGIDASCCVGGDEVSSGRSAGASVAGS